MKNIVLFINTKCEVKIKIWLYYCTYILIINTLGRYIILILFRVGTTPLIFDVFVIAGINE